MSVNRFGGVHAVYCWYMSDCVVAGGTTIHHQLCRKYFMPTHATTTHTQLITAVHTINAG